MDEDEEKGRKEVGSPKLHHTAPMLANHRTQKLSLVDKMDLVLQDIDQLCDPHPLNTPLHPPVSGQIRNTLVNTATDKVAPKARPKSAPSHKGPIECRIQNTMDMFKEKVVRAGKDELGVNRILAEKNLKKAQELAADETADVVDDVASESSSAMLHNEQLKQAKVVKAPKNANFNSQQLLYHGSLPTAIFDVKSAGKQNITALGKHANAIRFGPYSSKDVYSFAKLMKKFSLHGRTVLDASTEHPELPTVSFSFRDEAEIPRKEFLALPEVSCHKVCTT